MSNDMPTAAGTVSGDLPRRTGLAESTWTARGSDISATSMPDRPTRVGEPSAFLFGVGDSGAFGQKRHADERHEPEELV
jgi:hypothetical protein